MIAMASASPEEFPLDIDEKDHALGLLRRFNQMRMQRKDCDLVIKSEGKEIHVHRSVMMAGSDFFNAMFTHDMEEKESGVVEMKDISFQTMKKLVSFVYTGKISMVADECEELLFASYMLQLTSVCDKIAPFLERHLSPSSFFATKMIADKFDLVNLKRVCDDFALRNLDQIVKEKEFSALDKEYIIFLVKAKNSSTSTKENSKLAILLQWIKADVENRRQYLMEFADLLDFQKISASLGKYLCYKEELCYQSPEFMRLLYLAAINDASVKEMSPQVCFGSSDENSVVVFDRTSKVLRAYNPGSKSWKQTQPIFPDSVGNYSAVVTDSFIYVFHSSKKTYRLNIIENGNTWERLADMLKERSWPQAAVIGGDVYVLGSHSMEKYGMTEGKWTEISCDNITNGDCCALVALSDSVYAIGGTERNGKNSAKVNRYSPFRSSWSCMPQLPSPRAYPAAAAFCDNTIFSGGGRCSAQVLNDFMKLNLKSDTWTKLSPMIKPRLYFKLCFISDQLYAVGNSVGACSIEKYDLEEERWKVEMDEDSNMKIFAAATIVADLP